MKVASSAIGLVLLCSACATAPVGSPLPVAAPESVGVSGSGLAQIDAFIDRLQREGKLAGAVTVVARHGRLVSLKAHGEADVERHRAMRADDLFQLQSMTKPIATVAALQLVEQGRLQLFDPVAKFLPGFADMKVAVPRGDAPGGHALVAAERPITILDLLTHRAGFVGLATRDSPAARLQRQAYAARPHDPSENLEQAVAFLATLPLGDQPGSAFRYGPATIVLSRVIEIVTGQTLEVALREQIFRPLGMHDTHFVVPPHKHSRVMPPYQFRPDRGLVRMALDPLAPRLLSAGGNLWSTAADYLRFCQMLLNGGELDGTRILSRASVALMTTPQVDTVPLSFLPGHAFGLGVALRRADAPDSVPGSPGTYGWSGAYSTWFRIAPREQAVYALFVQLAFTPADSELQRGFHAAAVSSHTP
ncbi:MAG: beta-lactamase family protein [Rubrivivax sp.]|nr:beta-lactamase family protein [Rubrivivax sp.]